MTVGAGKVGIGTTSPVSDLTIRRDAGSALGPVLTLLNGSGGAEAGGCIDFNGYDVGANQPTLRVQSLDDGNGSSHLAIHTKKPGVATNVLVQRMLLSSIGNLYVQGSIYANGAKPFIIDHPLDRQGKHLVHAAVEGPEAGVYYRGEGTLSDGTGIVVLPDYFEALTHREGRTVTLTPRFEGSEPVSSLAASAVIDGRFMVKALDGRNPFQRFYWEVKAVRADIPLLDVERKKDPSRAEAAH